MTYRFLKIKRQKGLTLVELMVAVAISLIVVLAATAALLVSRQGFRQVDATAQLRENAKFSENLIQRLAVQAGYRDVVYAATPRPVLTDGLTEERPNVYGFNNSTRKADDRSDQATGSSGTNGSDILVLRFQSAAQASGANGADKAIIDCAGFTPSSVMADRYQRYSSVFHVSNSSGEPTLMCTRWADPNETQQSDTHPLISGVENFQVLYGVDGIKAGNTTFTTADSVAETYLRADQITVSDPKISLQRWQRVRSIRIGMVVRAATGTAIGPTNIQTRPFGSGTAAAMFSSTSDTGTIYTPPNDGRLRQSVAFTIHLRNPQGDE